MRKTIFTITAIGILGVLACSSKKDPEPAPKSKFDLLTAHSWKVVAEYDSTGKNIPSEKCEEDDQVKFLTNYYLEILEGDSVCPAGEISSRENKWQFMENETKIWFYRPNFTSTIIKLTDDSLILKDDLEKSITKASK